MAANASWEEINSGTCAAIAHVQPNALSRPGSP
jgi:hypothetical protein